MRGFKSVIRSFSPSWFAVVMGTGVFATSTYLLSIILNSNILMELFKCLTPLNFILFFVIFVPWILKWLVFPLESIENFKHPVEGNFYVTIGIGALVLSMNLFLMNLDSVALAFWIFGSLAVVVIQIALMFLTFVGKRVRLEHISPVWFLSTTGLLLIPSVGVAMISSNDINSYYFLLFDFAFGTGFLLYLYLMAIWLYRFILHEPIKGDLIPLFWINMGPIGAGITSLMTYFSFYPEEMGSAVFFAIILLGFGLWWFLMSVMVIVYYIRNVSFSYRSIWWSFTFPLGQFLVGMLYLNDYLKYESLFLISIILYAALIFLWTLNIILTLKSFFLRRK